MKLLTQNLIKCQAGDCSTADISSEPSPYPLKLTIETSENEKTEDFYSFNAKVKMVSLFLSILLPQFSHSVLKFCCISS